MRNLLKDIVSRKFIIPKSTIKIKEMEVSVVSNRTIFVVAGHSGPGTGANGFIDEGKETIIFRDKLADELRKYNINVDGDFGREKSSLRDIIATMKSSVKPNDISIDIHFNAVGNPSVSGTEVFIPTNYTMLEQSLATTIANTMSKSLGIKNRGVKTEKQSAHKTLGMLSGFDCLNILIEVCFVSNKADADSYYTNRDFMIKQLGLDIKNFLINNP